MLIDLTIPLNDKTPVYPGDPRVLISPLFSIKKDGFSVHSITTGTHLGTHIDAPSHMIEGGKNLSDYPIDFFIGNGLIVDVSKDFSLETLQKYTIKKNDIVLFYTGWEERRNAPEYFEKFPSIPIEVCSYLIEKKVKIVGTDSPSADDAPFTSHKLLLQNNILIIEALINIKQLIDKKFTITALPLRLALDGSPVRVIAKID